MNAIVLSIKKRPSRYGGSFYYIYCKTEEGISCKSCVSPNYGNFTKWRGVIGRMADINDKKIQATLVGVRLRGKLLDADVLGPVNYVEISHDED
ncbi:hypothetical protein LJC07_04830 [Christensenellaceae bacterium OttesenSCG-928-L17]|nr:hypothetical protein [Christensenellaceae bacterium OttesenSCG-928-L17]